MRNLLNCERPSPDFTSFKNGEKLRLQKHLSEGKALRIASCLNLFFVPIWSIILPNQPTFKHFFIVPNLQEWNVILSVELAVKDKPFSFKAFQNCCYDYWIQRVEHHIQQNPHPSSLPVILVAISLENIFFQHLEFCPQKNQIDGESCFRILFFSEIT